MAKKEYDGVDYLTLITKILNFNCNFIAGLILILLNCTARTRFFFSIQFNSSFVLYIFPHSNPVPNRA